MEKTWEKVEENGGQTAWENEDPGTVTAKKSKTGSPETGWASSPGKILASNLGKNHSVTFRIVCRCV